MKSKKYTLIELMVVMVIIMIAIGIAIALVIGGIFAYKGYTAMKEVGLKQSVEEVWEGPQKDPKPLYLCEPESGYEQGL